MGKSKGGFGQDVGPEPAAPAVPTASVNPVVAAAQGALVELFDTLAKDWPALINSADTPGAQMQPFTKEMLALLTAQLRQALGVGDGGTKP